MINLKPIHQEVLSFNGHDHVSAIINFDWLLDSISEELKLIESQYKRTLIPTNFDEISIRFIFNHSAIKITALTGDTNFTLTGFNFQLELVDKTQKVYGSIFVQCNTQVKGDITIVSSNNGATDTSYSFSPIENDEIEITLGEFDESVILDNFDTLSDFQTSVKAISLFLDYNEYLDDLFNAIPTPNVFGSLASYNLKPPYNIQFKNVVINGINRPFLFVKGAPYKNSTEFCDCGEPGGIITEDEIIEYNGEEGYGSRVERTRVTRDAGQVKDQISGKFVAGFLFPFHDETTNEYKTFMKDFTSETSLVTTIKDSGKKSGVNWSYQITASVPIQNIQTQIDYDATNKEYSIMVNMPHSVDGTIHLRKKIGCGVSIRDRIDISNGAINPYKIKLKVKFVLTSKGSQIILIPETKAQLRFRLRPRGIFAFLVSFFGRVINRKLVEKEIIEKTNNQLISFIKTFVIPTIPKEKLNVGSTIVDKTLFIALGESYEPQNDGEQHL